MNTSYKNILVILPISRDRVALNSLSLDLEEIGVNIHYLEDSKFIYDGVCKDFDVISYVESAIKYVKDHAIDGIIYTHDMASLVAAVVCEKTDLKGPSLESVFIACHKYYSRKIDLSNINCRVLDLKDKSAISNLTINYPCYIKAPCLMCSHLQFIAHNEQEMYEVIEIMRRELPTWANMFFDFFSVYIDKEKYPYAHQSVVIVEELVSDYKQCAIEGWVDQNGKINIWAISDINYHGDQRQSQNCYSMPSSVSEIVKYQLSLLTKEVIEKIKLRSGFFNVDMWHWNGKKPAKVIEINGRAASLYYLMHQQCFSADLYKAMIFLSLGEDQKCYLESPLAKMKKKPNMYGALFFIVTFDKGIASKILNFSEIDLLLQSENVYGVELFVSPDSIIGDNGTAGYRLGKFYLFGTSFENINTEANYWRLRILKNIDLSPYKQRLKKIERAKDAY